MNLIKYILLILLLTIYGCDDKKSKISKPYPYYIYKIYDYSHNIVPNEGIWIFLDFNYYLIVNNNCFSFITAKNNYNFNEEDNISDYGDYFDINYIEIDSQNSSFEFFSAKLEELLNITQYYLQDKLEEKKLTTIKKIIKEYFYYLERQNKFDSYHMGTFKTFHKGIILKEELIMDNSMTWNFENIYNNNKYVVELSVYNNLYKLHIR